MSVDRRKFVKVAGLGMLALAAKPATELFGQDVEQVPAGTAHKLPQENPATAKRWAMVIDTRKCREHPECDACVHACHEVHNVPDFEEKKDEIKWMWQESYHHAFLAQENKFTPHDILHSNVLLLCNHCDDPPCVKVCPTQATFQREDGIVMMDWHRCIGCRYCIAGCPYGSRSFNWRDPREGLENINPDFPTREKGVVEKCTFCDSRLAKGQMPACVEVCPHGGLAFGDLEDEHSDVRKILERNNSIRRKPGLGTKPQVYYIV